MQSAREDAKNLSLSVISISFGGKKELISGKMDSFTFFLSLSLILSHLCSTRHFCECIIRSFVILNAVNFLRCLPKEKKKEHETRESRKGRRFDVLRKKATRVRHKPLNRIAKRLTSPRHSALAGNSSRRSYRATDVSEPGHNTGRSRRVHSFHSSNRLNKLRKYSLEGRRTNVSRFPVLSLLYRRTHFRHTHTHAGP